VLKAPEESGWNEVWRVESAPIWHVTHTGLPPISTRDPSLAWRPWPGESLTLSVTRPKGVEGNTLTIDNALLRLRPGRNTTESSLALTLRSSRGGQYTLALPEGADLQSVTVDGDPRPPTRVEGKHTLPRVPGSQSVEHPARRGHCSAAPPSTSAPPA
jgi:hypothetical protein